MTKYILYVILGVALFFGAAWGLGLFEGTRPVTPSATDQVQPAVKPEKLGPDLYAAEKFKPIELPKRMHAEPIVLYGVMNAFETQEVSSEVQGKVLFIGDQV